MKKPIILTTILAALLPLVAFAQSPAPTSAPAQQQIPPVPPAPPVPPLRHLRDNRLKEPVTFLGVETSDVPRVLSEQMGLPRGFGVVVDYVVPNSPAAAAGLQPSDIIRMLNDQIIVEPGQLGKLVRNFADGTTVNLTLLRKGQEVKVTVKLAKHDVPSGHNPMGFEKEWNFDGLDKMNFDFQMPDMTAVRETVQRARDEAMRAGDEARRAARRLRIVTTDDETTKSTRVDLGKATITFSDEQGELKLERVDGKKMLTARDAQGKELFNGPIDTEEERAKIPANVRARFEKLEKQELPEIPPAPETPSTPADGNESAHLQNPGFERAALSPGSHTGWRRSTALL
ncbi:MAG: S1C family serine protease [Chthoniobacterales bacterium]